MKLSVLIPLLTLSLAFFTESSASPSAVRFSPDQAEHQGNGNGCHGDDPEAVTSRGVEAPRLIAQSGHSEDVTALSISPRSTLLATGSKDGSVKLWLAKSGQLLRTLSTSTYWVHSVAFSGDGCLVAAGSGDHKIYIWDLESGELATTLEPHAGAVKALAFSADGNLLASSTTGRGSNPKKPQTILWDVHDWHRRTQLECDRCPIAILDLAFLPGSSVLALKSTDELLLWDYEANRVEQRIERRFEDGGRLFVSRDGSRLACSGAEAQAHGSSQYTSYTYSAGISMWTVFKGHIDEKSAVNLRDMWAIGMTPDGNSMVAQQASQLTFSGDSSLPKPNPTSEMKIVLCSMTSSVCQGEEVMSLPGLRVVALSPDGKWMAYSAGHEMRIVETGGARSRQVAMSRATGVTAIYYSGDILAVGLREGQISVWDRSLRYPARSVQQPILDTGRGVKGFSLDADKGELLSAGADGGVMRWGLTDLQDKELRAPARGARGDSTVSGREEIGLLRPEPPKALTVSVDGVPQTPATEEVLVTTLSSTGVIATGGLYFDDKVVNGFVSLWDTTGARIGDRIIDIQRKDDDVTALAFSPDGKTLGIGFSGGGIDLWSVEDRRVISRFDEHASGITALAFSAGAEYLASGSLDKTVKVWSLRSPGPARTLTGHNSPVLCLNFSPERDADLLASGGADNRIILWRVSSGVRTAVLEGHSASVNALAFMPNGRVLISGGEDATVQFWDTSKHQLLAVLVAVGGGNQWLATTPSGFFDGDEGSWNQVIWQFGRNLFDVSPVEIGFRDYFVPNLLAKTLNSQPPATRSFTSLNRAQPTVQIQSVTPDGPDTVRVDVIAESQLSTMQRDEAGHPLVSGVYDIRLFRNGQLVGTWPEVKGTKLDEVNEVEEWRHLRAVQLDPDGKVRVPFRGIRLAKFNDGEKSSFTAYAFNRDRVKGLTSTPFEYKVQSTPGKPLRRAYLITMGVNANQSGWNLDVAVPSAEKALSLLHAKLAERYSPVIDVQLYSDLADDGSVKLKHARKDALRAVFDLLSGVPVDSALSNEVDSTHQIQPVTPDDAVVLYVASHGYADPQGNLYIIPFDTGVNFGISEEVLTRCASRPSAAGVCGQAQSFLQHAVSSADLSAWWQGVDAGEFVMILDSCHSGALPGRTFRPGPLGDPGFGQLSYDKRMTLFAASQPTQTELGVWVTGGEGRTLLVDALASVAHRNPSQSLMEWLRGTERQLPVTFSKLYPKMKEDELQSPVLLDFSGSDSRSISNAPTRPQSPTTGATLQVTVQ